MLGYAPNLYPGDPSGMLNRTRETGAYPTGNTPQVGALCIGRSYNDWHVSVVEEIRDGVPYVSESGWGTSSSWPGYQSVRFHYGPATSWMNNGIVGYIYLPVDTATHDPAGYLDGAWGGDGVVRVAGWTKDPDNEQAQLEVHAYIGGDCSSGIGQPGIMADIHRDDVGAHGFERTIETVQRGAVDVYVYAINTGQGNNVLLPTPMRVTVLEPRGNATTSLESGRYTIRSKIDTNKALDVYGGSSDDQTPAILNTWHGRDNQIFDVIRNDDGTYSIVCVQSDKALEIYCASTNNQDPVTQYTRNGSAAQRWWVEEHDDGTWSFRNRVSGKYMDDFGAQTNDGNAIIQFDGNRTAAQQWYLIPVNAANWTAEEDTDDGSVHVYAADVELAEGRDYELTYGTTNDDGYTTATISGINGFTGTMTLRVSVHKSSDNQSLASDEDASNDTDSTIGDGIETQSSDNHTPTSGKPYIEPTNETSSSDDHQNDDAGELHVDETHDDTAQGTSVGSSVESSSASNPTQDNSHRQATSSITHPRFSPRRWLSDVLHRTYSQSATTWQNVKTAVSEFFRGLFS